MSGVKVERRDTQTIRFGRDPLYSTRQAWWVTDFRERSDDQYGPFDTWREAMDFADRMVL